MREKGLAASLQIFNFQSNGRQVVTGDPAVPFPSTTQPLQVFGVVQGFHEQGSV